MSLPEVLFWKAVQHDQLGCRVRRQVAKGPYFLDFYVARYRLAIEIDGDHHLLNTDSDAERDAFLKSMRIQVLRISAKAVLTSVDDVVDFVRSRLAELDSKTSDD